MISKHKLYSIALMSAAIILMMSITYAAPFAYITNSGSNNIK